MRVPVFAPAMRRESPYSDAMASHAESNLSELSSARKASSVVLGESTAANLT
jgi:hypothetical protein